MPRPRLTEALESGVQQGMVILSAPAGAGKTLLLASWSAQRPGAVGWLSLQAADAAPGRFLARLHQALAAAPDVAPDSSLAALGTPATYDDGFVDLVAACDELPGPRVLVLDDVHLLTGTRALEELGRAVRRGLGSLRLVLSTRVDPALPLQRLRLSGELAELRTADLAFTAAEAAELFERHGLRLSPAHLRTVLDRTEGWAAGLRLAALSLSSSGDAAAAVQRLAGEQRTVADYFVEEVLARVAPETRDFLLDTSVVRCISADLVNALTGRTDGQRLLDRLERENLFVVALDDRRGWYRYHRMFGDLLRHRLVTQDPDRGRLVHARAAAWYSTHGDGLEAARHLAAAGDWHGLARHVLRTAVVEATGGGGPALAEALAGLRAEDLARDPELAAAAALAGCAGYDAQRALAHAAQARRGLHALPEGDRHVTLVALDTVEALAAWMADDTELQERAAAEAVRGLESVTVVDVPALSDYRAAAATVLALAWLRAGRLDEAGSLLTRAVDDFAAGSGPPPAPARQAHAMLALVRATEGRLNEATARLQAARDIAARQSDRPPLPLSAVDLLAEAVLHLARAEPATCAKVVDRGLPVAARLGDRFTEAGLVLARAAAHLASGDVAATRTVLDALRDGPGEMLAPAFLRRWWELMDAETVVAEGRTAWTGIRLLRSGRDEARWELRHALLRAWAAYRANRVTTCLEVVQPVTGMSPADVLLVSEAWLLVALARDRLRQDAAATTALARALDIAAGEGVVAPFVRAGDQGRTLLERYRRSHDRNRPFVQEVLAKVGADGPAPPPGPPVEPLTDRERSVLMLLPAMLSNAEIADELCVSVNTVKVHLKSLYRKLGVGTRRKAVLRARELGLATFSDHTDRGGRPSADAT